MESLGNKITALRKKANKTQDELAAELEVTRQAVSQWELDTAVPKADKLKALCEYFNVRPDYFLFENSEMKPLVPQQEELAATSTAQPQKKTRKQIAITISIVIASVVLGICAVVAILMFYTRSSCFAAISEESVGLNDDIDFENVSDGYGQILN